MMIAVSRDIFSTRLKTSSFLAAFGIFLLKTRVQAPDRGWELRRLDESVPAGGASGAAPFSKEISVFPRLARATLWHMAFMAVICNHNVISTSCFKPGRVN